jgi:hypothetical protein
VTSSFGGFFQLCHELEGESEVVVMWIDEDRIYRIESIEAALDALAASSQAPACRLSFVGRRLDGRRE